MVEETASGELRAQVRIATGLEEAGETAVDVVEGADTDLAEIHMGVR